MGRHQRYRLVATHLSDDRIGCSLGWTVKVPHPRRARRPTILAINELSNRSPPKNTDDRNPVDVIARFESITSSKVLHKAGTQLSPTLAHLLNVFSKSNGRFMTSSERIHT